MLNLQFILLYLRYWYMWGEGSVENVIWGWLKTSEYHYIGGRGLKLLKKKRHMIFELSLLQSSREFIFIHVIFSHFLGVTENTLSFIIRERITSKTLGMKKNGEEIISKNCFCVLCWIIFVFTE